MTTCAAFYDAALGALGMRRAAQMPENEGTDGIGYGVDYPVFWIDVFHAPRTRQHTAFVAKNQTEVDDFYTAAMSAGGKDNGAPGAREGQTTPIYYAAFVFDPEGNNIEAVYRGT
jgi:catechol 2,3-dioxygenase-like lactoylglutathione lyase family enzyme